MLWVEDLGSRAMRSRAGDGKSGVSRMKGAFVSPEVSQRVGV